MDGQKGVTMVVLIITVIVLAILSAVVITTQTDDKSQLKQTLEITESSFTANVVDSFLVHQTDIVSKSEFWDYIKEEGFVDDNNRVDVKRLFNTTDCQYGMGSDGKDEYILEDDLKLYYYDHDENKKFVKDLGEGLTN